MITLHNIINGEIVPGSAADGSDAATLPFFDPATGVQLGTAPDSDAATVDRAFQAAHTAFQSYKRTTPAERQAMMLKLADLIEANVDRLLDAEVACTGKPRQITREIEILRGADQLRFFAGACRVVSGTAQTEYVRGFSSTVRREPLGVVAQITPWNYPFMMAIWKIGPALAAGNTLVLKPADTTPWSTLVLGELAQEAYPAGVVNVICGGRGTGAAMVDHEIPEMVSITGSTRAGAQVMSAASKTLKDVHLELGGKAPAIVFADTDIDLAAREIALGAFFNAGQDCTAVTRVLVEESIHQEFGAALAAAAAGAAGRRRRRGPGPAEQRRPAGPGGRLHVPAARERQGPGRRQADGRRLPLRTHRDRRGVPGRRGGLRGDLRTRGHRPALRDEAEAMELANGTKYALASSVWSNNHGVVTRVSNELDFGAVWINCHQVIPAEAPHGGFKHSGTGKDLSVFGLEDYTRIKSVTTSHR